MTVSVAGADPSVPAWTSFTITVPAAVPSVRHSSLPYPVSLAVK